MKLKLTALLCAMLTMSLTQAMQKNPSATLNSCKERVAKHEAAYYELATDMILHGEKKDQKSPLLKEIEQTINGLASLGDKREVQTLIRQCTELSENIQTLTPDVAAAVVASLQEKTAKQPTRGKNASNITLFDADSIERDAVRNTRSLLQRQQQIAQDEQMAKELLALESKNAGQGEDEKIDRILATVKSQPKNTDEKRARVIENQERLLALLGKEKKSKQAEKQEDPVLDEILKNQLAIEKELLKNKKKEEDTDSDSDTTKRKSIKERKKAKPKKVVDSDSQDSETESKDTRGEGLLAALQRQDRQRKAQEKEDRKKTHKKEKKERKKIAKEEEDEQSNTPEEEGKESQARIEEIAKDPIKAILALQAENGELRAAVTKLRKKLESKKS